MAVGMHVPPRGLTPSDSPVCVCPCAGRDASFNYSAHPGRANGRDVAHS